MNEDMNEPRRTNKPLETPIASSEQLTQKTPLAFIDSTNQTKSGLPRSGHESRRKRVILPVDIHTVLTEFKTHQRTHRTQRTQRTLAHPLKGERTLVPYVYGAYACRSWKQ